MSFVIDISFVTDTSFLTDSLFVIDTSFVVDTSFVRDTSFVIDTSVVTDTSSLIVTVLFHICMTTTHCFQENLIVYGMVLMTEYYNGNRSGIGNEHVLRNFESTMTLRANA